MSKKILQLLLVMVTVFSVVIFSPTKADAYSSEYEKPTLLTEDLYMSGLEYNPYTGEQKYVELDTYGTYFRYCDIKMNDGSKVPQLMGMASVNILDPREQIEEQHNLVYTRQGALYTSYFNGKQLILTHSDTLSINLLSLDYLYLSTIIAADGNDLIAYNLETHKAQIIDLEGEFIEPIYIVRKYKAAETTYFVLTRAAEIYEVSIKFDLQTNKYFMADCALVYNFPYLGNLDDGASIAYDGIWVYTITNYVRSDDAYDIIGYSPITGELHNFCVLSPDCQGNRLKSIGFFGKTTGVGLKEHEWTFTGQSWYYKQDIGEWRCYVSYKCSECNYDITLSLAVRKVKTKGRLITTYTAEISEEDAPDGCYQIFEKVEKPTPVPVPIPEPIEKKKELGLKTKG